MLLAVTVFAAPSAAQLPDLPDVPDLPEIPELPPVPVPDEPPPPPLPVLPGSSGESGSTADDGGSTTAPSGSSSSPSGSRERAGARRSSGEKTRFDRLPRRYEALLERILHGRGVNANLRRLERALASASPELRARIARLVRREIAALRRGDVTPQDRRRIQRLQRVEALFAPAAGASAAGDLASPVAAGDDSAVAASSDPAAPASGSGTAASEVAPQVTEPKADTGSVLPGLPFPDELTLGAVVVVLAIALLVLAGIAFVLAAWPGGAVPAGRARAFVTSSRPNLAFTGLVALAATVLVVLAGTLF